MQRIGNLKYYLFIFGAFAIFIENVQAQKLWSEVSINRKVTYVNQPVEVTISVYTSTWFTTGLDPGNIKVNGAFTTYFRPLSTSFKEKGQTYAGIQLIYQVFPFQEDDITFPSLSLEIESPPDGDYIGVKRILKTKERIIKVRPIPPGFNKSDWLVANSLSVSDEWSTTNRTVKVGNVLERKISRVAYGTVAELIPSIMWDSIGTVSQYPSRSTVKNHKTKTAISGSRIESMRYLFEEEGHITFPEMTFTWYHPYQKKLYKRTLKEVTFKVEPNPDLGVLTSVRDSLIVEAKINQPLEEEQTMLLFGLTPKEFIIYLVLGLAMFYVLFKLFFRFYNILKERRKKYLHSEAFYFDQFKNSMRDKHRDDVLKYAYRWLDELGLKEPSLLAWSTTYGSPELVEKVNLLEEKSNQIDNDIKDWTKARINYFQHMKDEKKGTYSDWINP